MSTAPTVAAGPYLRSLAPPPRRHHMCSAGIATPCRPPLPHRGARASPRPPGGKGVSVWLSPSPPSARVTKSTIQQPSPGGPEDTPACSLWIEEGRSGGKEGRVGGHQGYTGQQPARRKRNGENERGTGKNGLSWPSSSPQRGSQKQKRMEQVGLEGLRKKRSQGLFSSRH
jgi:hypothetical protein